MASDLVLSLFPGIGIFDRGFELEGYCVVRGPDVIWGGDVRDFHPPAGVFEGVIGGPPCKGESNLAYLNGSPGLTLKHEFLRCVEEASPEWWVMEAVKQHPAPHVTALNNRWIGEKQNRLRYFHSNLPLYKHVKPATFEHVDWKHAVLAGHGGAIGSVKRGMAKYTLEEACELQGLPSGFTLPWFTRVAAREAIGNAVPLPMARAVARAVRKATASPRARG